MAAKVLANSKALSVQAFVSYANMQL